jgi:hypothetical protein
VSAPSQPVVPVGGSVQSTITITNQDNTNSHTLETLQGTFSSSPASAASHLSYTLLDPTPDNSVFSPGQSATFAIRYSVDATMPAEASGGSWTLTWTGITNP